MQSDDESSESSLLCSKEAVMVHQPAAGIQESPKTSVQLAPPVTSSTPHSIVVIEDQASVSFSQLQAQEAEREQQESVIELAEQEPVAEKLRNRLAVPKPPNIDDNHCEWLSCFTSELFWKSIGCLSILGLVLFGLSTKFSSQPRPLLPGEEAPETGDQAPDPTLSVVENHLKLHIVPTRDPCDNFYSFACGRFHKIRPLNTPSIINGVPRLIEKTLKKWIVEDSPNETYTKNFQTARSFYRSCMDTPDDVRDATFEDLLKTATTITDKIRKDGLCLPLTINAYNLGLYPHVFFNISIVSEGNFSTFLVGPPLDVLSTMHEKLWNEDGLVHVSKLVKRRNMISMNNLGKLRNFALGLYQLVKANTLNRTYDDSVKLCRSYMAAVTIDVSSITCGPYMGSYLFELQKLVNKTSVDTITNYLKIMLTMHDCIYLSNEKMKVCRLFQDVPTRENGCYHAARHSPWFMGMERMEYTMRFDNQENRDLMDNIYSMINITLARKVSASGWLNSIARRGAFIHLENLTIDLGWLPGQLENQLEYGSNSSDNVVTFVTQLRMSYAFWQVKKLELSREELEIANEIDRPTEYKGLAYYSPKYHKIVVHPAAFQILLKGNEEVLPMYYSMATLGVWIATALIQSFDFPDIKLKQCTFPKDFWKYNIKLYESNLIHCTSIQHDQYSRKFYVGRNYHDKSLDYEEISRYFGASLAFNAYRQHEKEDTPTTKINFGPPTKLFSGPLTTSQAFWAVLTTYMCDGDALHNSITGGLMRIGKAIAKKHVPPTLIPKFDFNAHSYTSSDFATTFKCHEHARMVPDTNCLSF